MFNQKIWSINICASCWKQLLNILAIDFFSEVIKLKVAWDDAGAEGPSAVSPLYSARCLGARVSM